MDSDAVPKAPFYDLETATSSTTTTPHEHGDCSDTFTPFQDGFGPYLTDAGQTIGQNESQFMDCNDVAG